jgi:hypothetical protein
MLEKFIAFLIDDLNLTTDQIHLAVRQIQQAPSELPMLLWQYGLVDIEQLVQMLDWLDRF